MQIIAQSPRRVGEAVIRSARFAGLRHVQHARPRRPWASNRCRFDPAILSKQPTRTKGCIPSVDCGMRKGQPLVVVNSPVFDSDVHTGQLTAQSKMSPSLGESCTLVPDTSTGSP